jgi:hypothetical protein
MDGRHVQLWGGPEDGATVFMDGADLPARVGVHRTRDGYLIPIRSRALNLGLPLVADHVAVYEHAQPAMPVPCRTLAAGLRALDDQAPLYLWRELVTRWAAQAP